MMPEGMVFHLASFDRHELTGTSTHSAGTENDGCAARSFPTVGADAAELRAFDDVETADSDRLVYDSENENAWIQSAVHGDRADLV